MHILFSLVLAMFPPGDEPIPLSELLMRWPNAESVQATLRFGEEHRAWVWKQYRDLPFGPDRYFLAWGFEVDHLLRPWQLLAVALDETRPEERRREVLEEMRAAIGEVAWQNGYLPPPIVFDRFFDVGALDECQRNEFLRLRGLR